MKCLVVGGLKNGAMIRVDTQKRAIEMDGTVCAIVDHAFDEWFVYYEMDGDAGEDHGVESFSTKDEAVEFINFHMRGYHTEIDDYRLIHGEELVLKPVSIVTGVMVDE